MKNLTKQQIEFHETFEHEARYIAKDEDDALNTMAVDAIMSALGFPGSNVGIFVRYQTDADIVWYALGVMAKEMCRFKMLRSGHRIKLINGSTIEILYIGEDPEYLWRLAGAEWQWMYLYKEHLFSNEQVKYLKTRVRNYPRTQYYSVKSIEI